MKIVGTCLVLLLLLAPLAVASPDKAAIATAGGQVTSVDIDAKSLVVKVDGPKGDPKDMTFVLQDDSKIVKGGAAVALADLKPGDQVTVTYKAEGGKNVVVNIGVAPKA